MNHRAQSYEESLDRETRRAEGIYYTPADIVVDMLSTLRVDGDETLCDPCCGGGNFLMGALEMGVRVENLYGFDSDPRAVDIARERVREATGFDATENIRVADFWDVAPTLGRRFDIIASNPPWGSHLDSLRRCDLSTLYGAGRSSDSSSLMLLAALSTLRKGGELTFLLPDAFFNIGSFEEVRRKVLALEITHLRDYGKPFRGLMTRAQSITLRNRKSKSDHQAECRYEGQQHLRSLRSFRLNPKSIINMWLSSQGAEVVEAIYAKPHITLANNATWGMGIVTGNNSLYCHREPEEGDVE
ncbi:MAG: N-6 DNA methylase, partial [Rikenellaceae bacterium]